MAYGLGAPATDRVSGDVWVNSALSKNATPTILVHGQQVLTQETGHALVIRYPADYNASEGASITYRNNSNRNESIYFESSHQYALMSFFENNRGGTLLGS